MALLLGTGRESLVNILGNTREDILRDSLPFACGYPIFLWLPQINAKSMKHLAAKTHIETGDSYENNADRLSVPDVIRRLHLLFTIGAGTRRPDRPCSGSPPTAVAAIP